MHRVHPKELLEISPEDIPIVEDVNTTPERKLVTTFSWSMAISHFEKVITKSANKAAVYYLDGHLILNKSYLQNITEEICKEYGLELLEAMVDLVVPIGFAYEPLFGSLPQIIEDAFKPLSKTGQRKVIVWVEDEHWNNPEKCILTPFIQQLLLSNAEPFLIAPSKYFDQEIISIFSRKIFRQITTNGEVGKMEAEGEEATTGKPDSENFAKTFAIFVKFGFLLALRAVLQCPVIILHFGEPVSEMVDAFQLVDLAETEGHKIRYFKNTAADLNERRKIVDNFVQKLRADVPSGFTLQGGRLHHSAFAEAESESEAEESGSAKTNEEGWEILEPDEYATLSD